MWNLVCRSESLDILHLEHFDWENDCMKVVLLKTKKDQCGIGTDMRSTRIKHVFASPYTPEMCPILILGLYIFATRHGQLSFSGTKLFPGSDQKQRFCTLLQRGIRQAADQYHGNLEEAGSHSLRKGGISHLLAFLEGPGVPTVYIRANWRIGDTEDRYIVGGAGGDQMCGRLLAGNDPSTAEFAVLPPHFSPEGMQEIQAIGWDKFIKSFNELPRGFRNCIPFFLASILYHLPTLQAWFPDPQHSIWEIPLFGMFGQDTMSRLNQLRDKVVLKVHSCQECGMLAHGIPTKTDIIHTIKELVTKVSKVEGMFTIDVMRKAAESGETMEASTKSMESEMLKALDMVTQQLNAHNKALNKTLKENSKQTQQGLERVWMKLHNIEENMKVMFEMITSVLHGNNSVRDGSSVEHRFAWREGTQDNELLVENSSEASSGSDMEEDGSLNSGADNDDATPGEEQSLNDDQVDGDWFEWGGERHMVPRDFEWPHKVSVRNMMTYWYQGRIRSIDGRVQRIRPFYNFYKLNLRHDLKTKPSRRNLYKARCVMMEIEKICRENGTIGEQGEIRADNIQECYDKAFHVLVERAYGKSAWQRRELKHRYEQLSYITFCNKLHLEKDRTTARPEHTQDSMESSDESRERTTYAAALLKDL